MAINRFYKRTPYEGSLYTLPVEPTVKAMAMAKEMYDTNYSNAIALKNNYIDALPQDRAEANALQKKYSDRIDEVVKRYDGDYTRVGADLRALQTEAMNDFAPGSKGAAIVTQKKTYDAWKQRQDERVKKGDILPEDVSLGHAEFMRNYKGISANQDGVYAPINIEDVAEYADTNKLFLDVQSKVPVSKAKVSYTKFENGLQTDVTEEVETKSPAKLKQAFNTALASDKKAMAYVRQQARYRGLDPTTTLQHLDNLTSQAAQEYAFENKSNESKSTVDPRALAAIKAAHQRDNIKYKHDLDKQDQQDEWSAVPLQQRQLLPIPGMKRPISEDWRKSLSGNDWWNGIGNAVPTQFGGSGFKPFVNTKASDNTTEKLSNIYNSETLGNDVFNKTHLKIAAKNAALSKGLDFSKMDQRTINDFIDSNEKLIVEQYNKDNTSLSSRNSFVKPLPQTAVQEVSDRNFNNMINNSPITYTRADGSQIENTNINELIERGEISYDDIYDKNGKRKISAWDYNVLGGGYGKKPGAIFGLTKVVDGKLKGTGSITVHDQSTINNPFFEMAAEAIDQVTTKGRPVSQKFVDPQGRVLIARSNDIQQDGVTKNQITFDIIDRDGNSHPYEFTDKVTGAKIPVGLHEFQKTYDPLYITQQGRHASSKDKGYAEQFGTEAEDY